MKVTAKINAADKTGVSAKAQRRNERYRIPEGVTPKITGVSDDVNESFMQLFVAMAAAIFVVYLIMVLAFGNASAPFAILFSLPLAVIGGLLRTCHCKRAVNSNFYDRVPHADWDRSDECDCIDRPCTATARRRIYGTSCSN